DLPGLRRTVEDHHITVDTVRNPFRNEYTIQHRRQRLISCLGGDGWAVSENGFSIRKAYTGFGSQLRQCSFGWHVDPFEGNPLPCYVWWFITLHPQRYTQCRKQGNQHERLFKADALHDMQTSKNMD